MTTFTTTDGSKWDVAVNVGTVKRCMDETGLRLTDLFASEGKIAEFFSDDVRFCEVVAAVIRPQLAAAGKTSDDFFAAIDGTVIEQAANALLEALSDFFQEPRKGLLKKVLARYQAAAEKVLVEGAAAAEKKLEAINFENLIQQTLTNSASNLQESAG